MKSSIILFILLIGTLSCKQRTTQVSQSAIKDEPVSIGKIIQKYDSLTEINYTVNQIWKGPVPGSVSSLNGNCSFIIDKSDTIIGAHYLFTDDRITTLYNGKIFIYSKAENRSAQIYNLDDYSNPRMRVTGLMLYFLSYNEIINDLKARLRDKPNSIKILEDTLINNGSKFRIKIVVQDTTINKNHRDIHKIIVFDKVTLLPIFAKKVTRTPGETYEGQIIEATFSQFDNSTSKIKKTFDLSSIPYQIQKVTYATDKQIVPRLKINETAPNWKAILINGDSVSSKQFSGKIMLLNFTSVNCGFCLKANEVLKTVDEKYKNSKLVVLSIYPIDKIDAIKYLISKSNITHSIIYDANKMQKEYIVNGYPNIFIIGLDGKLAYYSPGFSDNLEKELIETIDKLLTR